jgi:hypothetical protein
MSESFYVNLSSLGSLLLETIFEICFLYISTCKNLVCPHPNPWGHYFDRLAFLLYVKLSSLGLLILEPIPEPNLIRVFRFSYSVKIGREFHKLWFIEYPNEVHNLHVRQWMILSGFDRWLCMYMHFQISICTTISEFYWEKWPTSIHGFDKDVKI